MYPNKRRVDKGEWQEVKRDYYGQMIWLSVVVVIVGAVLMRRRLLVFALMVVCCGLAASVMPGVFARPIAPEVPTVRIPDGINEENLHSPVPESLTTVAPQTTTTIAKPVVGAGKVAASTWLVHSTACGEYYSGTGFAIGPHLLLTAAHVVAGGSGIQVQQDDGTILDATVVDYDQNQDIALLRVKETMLNYVKLGTDEAGISAVYGHPKGQNELAKITASWQKDISVNTQDIYGKVAVVRNIVVINSPVLPGDSGGPVVDKEGNIEGLTFALNTADGGVGYAVSVKTLTGFLHGAGSKPVSTGACSGDATITMAVAN